MNTISVTLYYLLLDAPVKGTELTPRRLDLVPYLLQGFLFYDLTQLAFNKRRERLFPLRWHDVPSGMCYRRMDQHSSDPKTPFSCAALKSWRRAFNNLLPAKSRNLNDRCDGIVGV